MKFKIPFTFYNLDKLKKNSRFFISEKDTPQTKKLQRHLNNSGIPLSSQEYNSIKKRSFILYFIFIFFISSSLLYLFHVNRIFIFSLIISFLCSFFIFFNQTNYPNLYNSRRIKSIEKNLIPALEDIMIQLNSGIPMFNIMANIASSGYGELSVEFRKAVTKINAGVPQLKVLEELGDNNSSPYFRRTLWQLSNGMRSGSDVSAVIEESIRFLNQEQLLQIQNYGNKLNPLIMFYLLITIILPALGITFLIIIASMLGLSQGSVIGIFIGMFMMVVIVQTGFLGIIKSIRPSLL